MVGIKNRHMTVQGCSKRGAWRGEGAEGGYEVSGAVLAAPVSGTEGFHPRSIQPEGQKGTKKTLPEYIISRYHRLMMQLITICVFYIGYILILIFLNIIR